MRASHLSILASAYLGMLAAALEAPIPGYDVFVPQWEVKARPDGETLSLNGTAEEVLEQLREINPDYDLQFGLDNDDAPDDAAPEVQKRQQVWFEGAVCDNFKLADSKSVADAARYLHRVKGKPSNGPGHGNCGRVSCGYKTGIWWCNDAPETKTLNSFGDIADGIYAVQQLCRKTRESFSGQAFHKDRWNVVVQWEDC